MSKALADERSKRSDTATPLALPIPSRKDEEISEVPTMLKDMEAKHGAFHFYSNNPLVHNNINLSYYVLPMLFI